MKSEADNERKQHHADEFKYQSGTLGLLRYATKFDMFLIVVGTLSAITHGISFPILALVFGQMTDAFITTALLIRSHGIHSVPIAELSAYLSDYSVNYLYIAGMVLVAATIQTLCWELSCERQVHRLRQMAFAQILRQDIPWYDTRGQSTLTNLLSDDVERIREGLGVKMSMVLQYMSTFMCGTVVGVLVNWRLTALLFLLAPILIATTAYLARLTAGSAAREQLKYSVAGGVAEEVLSAVRTVAAFGTELAEAKRYERALEEGRRLAMHKYYQLAGGLVLVFFVMYAQYAVAFYYGSVLVSDRLCTPGSVFTVFFSVLAGAFTLGNALPYVNSVSTALGAASSLLSVVDRVPTIDAAGRQGLRPQSLRGHVRFTDVVFCYPSRPDVKVLDGLTLDIEPGQTVAVVGGSGSGKSTVVNLLLRLYDPTAGTVSVDGVPLPQLSVSWLRARVGVVCQEPVLFGVSIADNIRYGRDGVSQRDVERAAALADAHAFIQRLPNGYATVLGERGAQLSGGQKQRIAIARALVRDPPLLVLDEATSALDGASEASLAHITRGRTTLTVAHRLSSVRHANVIYTLEAGRVAERGTHEQLLAARGLYYRLVHTEHAFHTDQQHMIPQINPVQQGLYTFFPFNWLSLSSSVHHLESFRAVAALEPVLADNQPQTTTRFHQHLYPEGGDSERDSVREVSMMALVRLNAPESSYLVLGVIGSCVSGAIMPVFAFFFGEVFTALMETGEQLLRTALLWAVMFVALGALAALGIWLEVVFMTLAVEKLVMRLRVMAYHNILRQPLGWFDLPEHASGRLITRLARDAPLIKGAAGLRLGQLLGSAVTLTLALTIAFVFGWKLALVLLLIVPLIMVSAYQQTAMLRRTQARNARALDSAGRVATECVQNIRTVQALGAEALLVRLYVDHLTTPFRDAKKQAVVFALMFGLSQAVIYGMYAAAFCFGAYLIKIGDMTPAQVYRVFFALAFCAASVGTSAAYVQDYNKAKMAARQMFSLIDRPSEIDPLSPHGLTPAVEGAVRFHDVFFHYPGRPDVQVLSGLSLAVTPGHTLAIVGQSGCGKSTVLALIERFYSPTAGNITVDGVDIAEMSVAHLRRHVGLVPQEPVLFNRSIRDNISYGRDAGLSEVVAAATIANCHQFISQLPQGYESRVGEGGSQLSGGQKQRVAIARALLRDPRILLLDEATSALDTASEKEVQEALERAGRGRTSIVIAHRLSTVERADVIAVMADGRVSEMGNHRQLLDQRGLYWRLASALRN